MNTDLNFKEINFLAVELIMIQVEDQVRRVNIRMNRIGPGIKIK